MKKTILITVDVEDWFQVENFKQHIGFSQWGSSEWRFEKNTCLLLDIFEKQNIKATFFILAWNAERAPGLVKEIKARGHEIASHGYKHELCTIMSCDELREDLLKSKVILEDIAGTEILGYRAPSFSINDMVIGLLKETGYRYDSSYNSSRLNKRHGTLDLSSYTKKVHALKDHDGFWEIPISNLKIRSKVIPWGGGAYFRLLNPIVFQIGVNKILNSEGVYNFFMHPWEVDQDQPRVPKSKLFFKFRHYTNLSKCQRKLAKFLYTFRDCTYITCSEYIQTLDKLEYSF